MQACIVEMETQEAHGYHEGARSNSTALLVYERGTEITNDTFVSFDLLIQQAVDKFLVFQI
jgi:hypothetical protein